MSAKNIKEFMVGMEFDKVFSDVNEVDENNIDGTFECGTKWVDYFLGSEGKLIIAEVIELMEYNEIMNSDHRTYLINLNLET